MLASFTYRGKQKGFCLNYNLKYNSCMSPKRKKKEKKRRGKTGLGSDGINIGSYLAEELKMKLLEPHNSR